MKKARARTSTGQSILIVSLLLVGCAAGARRSEPPNMGAVETPARRTEPASPAVDADQTPSAPPTVIDVEHPPPQTDPTPSAPAAAQPGDDAIRDRAFAHYRVKVWAWLNVRLASALRSARVPCVAERRLAFQVSLKIAPDLRITEAHALSASGHEAFDRAVHGLLPRLVGERIPAPPPRFPEIAPTTLDHTFVNDQLLC